MQYALQCRHDQRRGKVTPTIVGRVVRLLVAAEISSLLDHDETGWRQRSGRLDSNARGLLMFAHRVVADLAEGDGWDGEGDTDGVRIYPGTARAQGACRSVRGTVDGLREEAEEAGGPLPKETVDKLTRAAMDAGVYGINMPKEWGGAPVSPCSNR